MSDFAYTVPDVYTASGGTNGTSNQHHPPSPYNHPTHHQIRASGQSGFGEQDSPVSTHMDDQSAIPRASRTITHGSHDRDNFPNLASAGGKDELERAVGEGINGLRPSTLGGGSSGSASRSSMTPSPGQPMSLQQQQQQQQQHYQQMLQQQQQQMHHAQAQYPPPFGGYGLGGQHLGVNVNIRNTRPMTAPSSVSAPYFQGAMYSPASGPSPYYPVGPPSSQQTEIAQYPTLFQYQVDSAAAAAAAAGAYEFDAQRARGFSLPDLVGLPPPAMYGTSAPATDPATFSDDPRYSSGGSDGRASPTSAGPFMYAPPPRDSYGSVDGTTSGVAAHQQLQSPFSRSRPTTADSTHPASAHPSQMPGGGPSPAYHTREQRNGEQSQSQQESGSGGESKQYNFVATAGSAHKRPRRRYDEIERLYNCDYPGCTKSYGTLNHLNSHKTMQKHGPRSTPAQFKEMRKAWRENKKRMAADAAAAKAAEEGQSGGGNTAGTKNGNAKSSAARGARGGPSNSKASLPAAAVAPTQRPRPATSAGEYHHTFTLQAPFLPAPSTVPPQPSAVVYPDVIPLGGGYVNGAGSHMGPGSSTYGINITVPPSVIYGGAGHGQVPPPPPHQAQLADSAQSSTYHHQAQQQQHHSQQQQQHRPLTAPHYFGVPAFGHSISATNGGNGPLSRLAAAASNSTAAGSGAMYSVIGGQMPQAAMIGPPRRMSLPGDMGAGSSGGMFSFAGGGPPGLGLAGGSGPGGGHHHEGLGGGKSSAAATHSGFGSILEEGEHGVREEQSTEAR